MTSEKCGKKKWNIETPLVFCLFFRLTHSTSSCMRNLQVVMCLLEAGAAGSCPTSKSREGRGVGRSPGWLDGRDRDSCGL